MSLNRDAISAVKDFKIKQFEVPEWGGSVYLRTLNVDEANIFSKLIGDGEIQKFSHETMATVLALSLCDKEGDLLFKNHGEGSQVLRKKSAAVVSRLFSDMLKLGQYIADDKGETAGEG